MPSPDAFDILDDFTQANGAIDGRIATSGYAWISPFVSTHVAGQITSNAFQGAAGQDRDAVLTGRWGPNIAVGARISALASAMYLHARCNPVPFPASSTNRQYYSMRVTIVGAADDDTAAIQRQVDGTSTTLATFNLSDDWAVGDEFGFQLIENNAGTSTLYAAWRKPSGGSWAILGSGVDSSSTRPRQAGGFAVEIDGTAGALDDLRGGTLERSSIRMIGSLSS